MAMDKIIHKFFSPAGIAIIGSFRPGFFGGYVAIKTLMDGGFKGKIFPVNPSYKEVLGCSVYPSLMEIDEKIDLAIIMIGRKNVPAIIQQCAKKNIKAVVIVSDGFAERDEAGKKLQKEIDDIAAAAGIRIIGPNTSGTGSSADDFNPCPYTAGYSRLNKGGVSICAQTGMINPQAYPYADLGYGISKICDLGNKCDVDECDMIEYLGEDPHTSVISIYMESTRQGRRFQKIAAKVSKKKPILVLKSGRTEKGAKASASHTGSLALDDKIFDPVCRQSGIIRLSNFSEIFTLPKIFAMQPLPGGNRFGVISFTGGVGVLCTDEGTKYGLEVTPFTAPTAGKLSDIFSNLGQNPIDMGPASASLKDFGACYGDIIQPALIDDNIDCALSVLWADPSGGLSKVYLKTYEKLQGKLKIPLVTWIYGPDLQKMEDLRSRLEKMNFPVFSELETAVKALGIAYQYTLIKTKSQ